MHIRMSQEPPGDSGNTSISKAESTSRGQGHSFRCGQAKPYSSASGDLGDTVLGLVAADRDALRDRVVGHPAAPFRA